ncbi:O-methyltransferase, family 3 [Cordyceps fumosorosea ARSEF 2679]|uniref:O-methyltransferase, family 3 n=1 Tax=Cordyceps fumosorosea (strain ARSEF 2679) TaxID=1081104 RepID=A0A167R7B3_CORFA|nr:O-methyltransferase, family 3 [Cordyceps fumosorosea ARSEF 2679]OAA58339.1 O-methyltransferase, family 3 [Cordyceps fumosorosea ARSEF 2679]
MASEEQLRAMVDQDKSLLRIIDFENFRSAPQIDAQARAALLRPNPKLDASLRTSAAHGLPPISVLPLAGQYLSVLTRVMGAKNVLEVGTLGGYSSICFAQAGARVTSVEIDAKHRDVAMQNVEGLDVEVLLGSSSDVLPKLVEEGRKFDIVFVDADMIGLDEQFDLAVKLTRPNGCIVLEDVVASMFKEGEVGGHSEENILTRIGKDERVDATLVPIVTCHPMVPTPVFNGFIFATVKADS